MPVSLLKTDLLATRAVIAKGWCQEACAKDASGCTVPSASHRAVSWCLIGATYNVDLPEQRRVNVDEALCSALGNDALSDWNDTDNRTQEEVLALIDKAIANA